MLDGLVAEKDTALSADFFPRFRTYRAESQLTKGLYFFLISKTFKLYVKVHRKETWHSPIFGLRAQAVARLF